jgi:hypothetical protein
MDRVERAVWEAVETEPTNIETVLLRTNLSLSTLSGAADQLVERGLLVAGAGWWSRV